MSRRILVFAHTGREESLKAAREACMELRDSGLVPVMDPAERADMALYFGERDEPTEVLGEDCELGDIELGVVLGGDGTILRAAEMVRETAIPLLGVNLGHVGFLAESERADLKDTVRWIARKDYVVEERMTIDIQVWVKGQRIWHTWALNEVSLEKGNRERMLEVVMEVDERPLTAFGCDGVVMATPTGSTAYAFSAGGPVVWPEVEALLMVPISAHALFAKPLVVSPHSRLAVEVLTRTDAHGVLWCDGRRSIELPPGARIEVTRSSRPVLLARTHETPFSARLVSKFELPTTGWRGPEHQARTAPTGPVPVITQPKFSTTPLPSPKHL
ncbi:NAD kinase [Arthrobacter sp. NPDC090010]|uniref:NAD kinase n=1 Tax=Arthrobacter sp. NPDC090010 TaxID=3363942 RepID=UPI0037FBDFC5